MDNVLAPGYRNAFTDPPMAAGIYACIVLYRDEISSTGGVTVERVELFDGLKWWVDGHKDDEVVRVIGWK